jgi:phosphopantetheine--protein transferase-like protein
MDNTSIGIDVVDIKDLQIKIHRSSLFLNKLLTEEERKGLKIETIAGKIAAKEAIIKTGFIKPGQWKNIAITADKNGAPLVYDSNNTLITNLKISITHTNKLAVAVAFYEKN